MNLLSHEDEWNSLLELAQKAVDGLGPTKREVKKEFSRLIKKQNPFAIEAQNKIFGHDKEQPGLKSSSAYERGAVYHMTNLFSSAGDSMNPRDPEDI